MRGKFKKSSCDADLVKAVEGDFNDEGARTRRKKQKKRVVRRGGGGKNTYRERGVQI